MLQENIFTDVAARLVIALSSIGLSWSCLRDTILVVTFFCQIIYSRSKRSESESIKRQNISVIYKRNDFRNYFQLHKLLIFISQRRGLYLRSI